MFGRCQGAALTDDGEAIPITGLIGFAEAHHARWQRRRFSGFSQVSLLSFTARPCRIEPCMTNHARQQGKTYILNGGGALTPAK